MAANEMRSKGRMKLNNAEFYQAWSPHRETSGPPSPPPPPAAAAASLLVFLALTLLLLLLASF
uniref:Uncharacterized protein n=1 Tax=Oryza rufipogon TaxID=4529 RepID=A0A0E0NAH3_ORYRU